MHRRLAFGYAPTVVSLLTFIALGRGAIPQLSSKTSFLAGQAVCLALLPAAYLVWSETRRSTGKLRRFLGYAIFGIDILISISACLAVVLIVATMRVSIRSESASGFSAWRAWPAYRVYVA
jgi:hypothetical protein